MKKSNIKYQCIQSNQGRQNWLFVPGGPGVDSSYYLSLIEKMTLPGKVWLIDFPYDQWEECLPLVVQRFDHPIYVGHSFSGMYPLLFPEIETYLEGFILICGAPVWDEKATQKMVKEKGYSIPEEPAKAFRAHPSEESLKCSMDSRALLHFPPHCLEEGRKFFQSLPIDYQAVVWWGDQIEKYNKHDKWVPKSIPMLIVGGSEDCVTPISIFQKDKRYQRSNITIQSIPGAGHFPWIGHSAEVRELFYEFIEKSQAF